MCYIMSNTIENEQEIFVYTDVDYKDDWHWFVIIDRADIGTIDLLTRQR